MKKCVCKVCVSLAALLFAAAAFAESAACGEPGLDEISAVLYRPGKDGGSRLAAAERIVAYWEGRPGFREGHAEELGRAYLALYRATRRDAWLAKARASTPAVRAAAEAIAPGVVARLTHEDGTFANVRCSARDFRLAQPEERTPDGEKCLSVRVLTDPLATAHAKQVRFRMVTGLTSGQVYRVSFWMKADRDLPLSFAFVSQAASPWANYCRIAGELSGEWTKCTATFEARADVPRQELSVPFLTPGKCPRGLELTLGPVTLERLAPHEIRASAAWRPIDMPDTPKTYFKSVRLPALEVKKGTALDLSQFLPRQDIDANGWLRSDARGRLYAENAPGRTIRLRGSNTAYGMPFDRFDEMDRDELAALADQIAIAGCNVLRLHLFDSKFVGLSGLKFYPVRNVEMEAAGIPQTEAELRRTLDAAFMDRYHWFVKCLRDRGVYLMFDVTTSRPMMTRAGKASSFSHVQMFFSETYRNHWKAALAVWLKTPNPYTDRRPVDDPQYFALTFFNEQEHLFNPKVGAAHLGKLRPGLTLELLREEGPRGDEARAFMRARIAEMNGFYFAAAKEAGFRGFVTNWDMYMRNLEGDARKEMSAVAIHPYHAHPQALTIPPDFVAVWPQSPWKASSALGSWSKSSVEYNSYLAHAALTRVLGKPFFLTEYQHFEGNCFVSEAPVVQSAAAGLQDWQMLTPHANLVRLYYYDQDAMSVLFRAASVATAFGWQRGDIAAAPHAVAVALPECALAGKDYLGTIGCAYNTLVWLTRVGSDYTARPSAVADLTVEPTCFAHAASMGMWAKIEEEFRANLPVCAATVRRLRAEGILPAANATDVGRDFYESETGEIRTDFRRRTMTVDAPRFQAAALKPGASARLSALEVTGVSEPASVLAISLDRDRPVRDASRLLLILATRLVPEDSVWMTTAGAERMLEPGKYRQLVKSCRFDFAVRTSLRTAPKAFALRLDGTRGEEIPVRLCDDRLVFELDTSTLRFGTPYFEVELPSAVRPEGT